MNRHFAFIGLIVGAMLAIGVTPALADEGGNGRNDRDGGYLALGDSVPFGFNPLALASPPAFDPRNPENFVGYPEVLAKRLHVDVTNASCPGETTMHFVALAGLDDNCGFYRNNLPLHVAYQSSQLDYAVAFLLSHPDTRLVTVMVGADDLGAFGKQCGATVPPADVAACVANDVATVSVPDLEEIFGTIRGVFHGKLVVVTYYARNNTPQEIGAVQQGDALITSIATQFGAQIADGFAAFQSAEGPSLDPCAARLLIRLPDGTCDSHPSKLGQKVLARAVQAVLRTDD